MEEEWKGAAMYAVVGKEEAITTTRPKCLVKYGECCMMKSRLS